ncbi:MAG TPA: chemotaxis protein CheW [Opitutaceae bacterium]|nr:chemotaxis protein CheW [Opitutaceae bacterium]
MSATHQLCTFSIGETLFGIDVQKIQEVIFYQEMTPVPTAPPAVRGLINLRGQIVTAIDLRMRLGLPSRTSDLLPTNVIVRTSDGAVSLLVDEIGDVVEVEPLLFERAPETLTGVAHELVTGIYKLEGRLLLLLDVTGAVTVFPEPSESKVA